MVWRNYVAAHTRFFREGDVQGAVDEQECPEAGILVRPDLDVPVEESPVWATREIVVQLKEAGISKPDLWQSEFSWRSCLRTRRLGYPWSTALQVRPDEPKNP
jgi:hypothetical protein